MSSLSRPAAVRNAVVAVGLLAVIGVAWSNRTAPLPVRYDELLLHVAGMHGNLYCPLRVTAALDGRAGIYDLTADVSAGTMRVRYDGAAWTPDSIAAAMRAHLRPPYELLGCSAVTRVGAP